MFASTVIFLNKNQFNKLTIGKNEIELDKDLLHYFKNVLRLRKNEKIIINNEENQLNYYTYFESYIIDFQKNSIILDITQKFEKSQNFLLIDVFIVPTKSKYFHNLIENLTQLPINKIFLIKSKYLIANFNEILKKEEKLKKIIYWNSIYVKKHYLIDLEILNISIENLLKGDFVKEYEKVIIFDHITENRLSSDFLNGVKNRICVMIGPEGGWAREEIAEIPPHALICKFKNIDIALKSELASAVGISQLLALL